MSPRRTELFHESRDLAHLGPVGLVGLEGGHLRGQSPPGPDAGRFMHQRGPDGLGLRQALILQLAQSALGVLIETNRYRTGHDRNVSRYALQMPAAPRRDVAEENRQTVRCCLQP